MLYQGNSSQIPAQSQKNSPNGCFWRVFLNSLNIPSRLYEVRAKFSVANETYFLYAQCRHA
nr:MAG TPA_asm: hypothetical protein [Bacteriophage sp.]